MDTDEHGSKDDGSANDGRRPRRKGRIALAVAALVLVVSGITGLVAYNVGDDRGAEREQRAAAQLDARRVAFQCEAAVKAEADYYAAHPSTQEDYRGANRNVAKEACTKNVLANLSYCEPDDRDFYQHKGLKDDVLEATRRLANAALGYVNVGTFSWNWGVNIICD